MSTSKDCLHRVVPCRKVRGSRPSCNACALTSTHSLAGIIDHDPQPYIVVCPAQVGKVVEGNCPHIDPVSANSSQLCQEGVDPATLGRLEYTRSRSREIGRSSRTRDIRTQRGVHCDTVSDIVTS